MKKRCQIKNWSEYNRALVNRGSITLWVSKEAIEGWHSTCHTGEKGRPQVYSDSAILCALQLRAVYHLTLRHLEGFLGDIVRRLKLSIKVPSYTQICRRAKQLSKVLKKKKLSYRRPTDIVIDSTGLKAHGEGEWKVRQHGTSKRRGWMKLHIAVDPKSQEIILSDLTDNGPGSGDARTAAKLIKKAPKSVKTVLGDGAYDSIECRRAVDGIGAKPIIPPPTHAVVRRKSTDPAVRERNDAVQEIRGLGGEKKGGKLWKKLRGYHKRSLAETAMYRIKQLTGPNLRSRCRERQRVEAYVKCLVVNKMTKLGMPRGKWQYAA